MFNCSILWSLTLCMEYDAGQVATSDRGAKSSSFKDIFHSILDLDLGRVVS